MAEQNLITREVLKKAKIREADFTEQFGYSVKKLVEALGVTRKVPVTAGTILKTYKASGTLQDGSVAEGEIIPLSEYTIEPVSYKEIELDKHRKATTAEAIVKYGYDQAVNMTTKEMLKDCQKGIRKNFFDFMATGTGRAAKSTTTLQATLAQLWGQLQVLFEDDEIEAVYFLNPLDIADYLGTAQITTQTAFGMSYIENFLGLGTVFMNTSVPVGKVYATAKSNIVMYYIAVNGADLGEVFSFTSDELGYIGIHSDVEYKTLTTEDVVLLAIEFFAERLDGVVIGAINGTVPAHTYTEDELNQMTVKQIKALADKNSVSLTAEIKPANKDAIVAEYIEKAH